MAAILLAACSGSAPAATAHAFPDSGLVLLDAKGGTQRGAGAVGTDIVAVTVSDDGHTAFSADSAPGDVYAVQLPALAIEWKQHVGGAPFGLLLHAVSLLLAK